KRRTPGTRAAGGPPGQPGGRRLHPRIGARLLGSCLPMLAFIVMLIVVGLIAGAIARLLLPGRDPIGLLGTILLGIAGSFVGGFLENLLFYHRLAPHRFPLAGIIGSIVGAFLVLLLLRASGHERGRSRRRYRRSWI